MFRLVMTRLFIFTMMDLYEDQGCGGILGNEDICLVWSSVVDVKWDRLVLTFTAIS